MATKKKPAVKAVKKPAAKKSAVKKPVAKKQPAAKPVAKKVSAAETKAKTGMIVASAPSAISGFPPKRRTPIRKPGKRKPVSERNPNRVAPRITRRPEPIKDPVEVVPEIKSEASINFAREIAEKMKKNAKTEDIERTNVEEIRLSRRPTTRRQGRTTEKFPAADLKEFRKRLIEARAKAQSGIDVMKSSGFNQSDDYEADGGDGTNQTLRLQALSQMGSINRTIQKIDEALHRIDDGTYGVCEICGQLIRKPRLCNQPFVLTCMECQSDVERREKGSQLRSSVSADSDED